jgi:hypothetical protein
MGAGAGVAPGTEDDGYGSYILRHTPNDSSTNEVAMDNLAVGIDPDIATLFVQSQVPELATQSTDHSESRWTA